MSNETYKDESDLLAVGRLGSPFGVQGFLRIHSYSGETDHLFSLKDVTLALKDERRPARIDEVADVPGGVAVLISGCAGPEDAKRWTGWDVLVPRGEAAPLQPGEYYVTDLVGCSLVYGGQPKGLVRSVMEGGSAPLLEIGLADGRTALVPFRNEFVGAVDTRGRTIELLVDWILE